MIQIIKTDSFRREEILPEPAEREEIEMPSGPSCAM